MSAIGVLRQLRLADAPVRRIFLSLQLKELFDGAIALIVWEQRRHNVESTLFGSYAENDG